MFSLTEAPGLNVECKQFQELDNVQYQDTYYEKRLNSNNKYKQVLTEHSNHTNKRNNEVKLSRKIAGTENIDKVKELQPIMLPLNEANHNTRNINTIFSSLNSKKLGSSEFDIKSGEEYKSNDLYQHHLDNYLFQSKESDKPPIIQDLWNSPELNVIQVNEKSQGLYSKKENSSILNTTGDRNADRSNKKITQSKEKSNHCTNQEPIQPLPNDKPENQSHLPRHRDNRVKKHEKRKEQSYCTTRPRTSREGRTIRTISNSLVLDNLLTALNKNKQFLLKVQTEFSNLAATKKTKKRK